MRRVLFLPLFALFAVGCGETCQSTCAHIYDPSECGITHQGFDADYLIKTCVSDCEKALANPGEMGTYNPTVYQQGNENVELEFDQQAAAWIDCVWEKAPEDGYQKGCEDIDPKNAGVCQPI